MNLQIASESTIVRSIVNASGRFLLAISLLVAMLLSACTNAESKDLESASVSSASEYIQTTIDFPEKVYFLDSLEKASNGKLWMVGTKINADTDNIVLTPSLWELDDDNSWRELIDFRELFALDAKDDVVATHITKSNQILCFVANYENPASGMRFFLIDSSLENHRELKIDTSDFIGEPTPDSLSAAVVEIFSLPNDQLLIQNAYASLFILDIASETIKPLHFKKGSNEWSLLAAAELDGTIYALLQNKIDHTSKKLSTLDVSSGTYGDVDAQKNKELVGLFSDHDSFESAAISTFRADSEIGRLTFCLDDGAFEYSNNEVKKIVDAEDTILFNTAQRVEACVFENQDDFFILCDDYSTGGESPYTLYKYEKVGVPIEISNTLRVWALEDNDLVRQAVTLYKAEHPDVEVRLEIGLDSEGLIVGDVIKRLNTEILAGEGPDVLILDGLPLEGFLERGVLHDLRDVYTEAMDSGQYYENIISAFASEGGCEILPLCFKFPSVTAERSIADKLDGLPALVRLATEITDNGLSQRPLSNMAVFDELLIASYPELFAQGELDEEALARFFESVGSLSEILGPNKQSSVLPDPGSGVINPNEAFDSIGFGMLYLYENPHQIVISELSWEQDLLLIETFVQNSEEDLVTEVFSLGQYSCFTPQVCVAVNADSKETELSKSFVRMLLSEKCQIISHRDGLSIMRSAFSNVAKGGFGVSLEDGQLGIDSLSEETIDAYQALFLSLDTPVVIDSVAKAAVYGEVQRYLDGEVSKEEAVDACIKK